MNYIYFIDHADSFITSMLFDDTVSGTLCTIVSIWRIEAT